MEYLSIQEITSLDEDIRREMELLLSNKAVVFKPRSLQWQFFKDCVNRLYNSNTTSKFNSLNYPHKAQLKFEIGNCTFLESIRAYGKIYETIRPQPRTSIPNRRKYSS